MISPKDRMADVELQTAPPAQRNAPGWCMALALLYLAGPLMIMAEVLKPVFWVPAFPLFLAWLWSFDLFLFPGTGGAGARGHRSWNRVPRPSLVASQAAVFVFAALWIYCSGIGSFTFCRFDYVKHNFIFTSLLQSHLPITADPGDGRSAIVHYYFAYYIVPVRVYQALHTLVGQVRLDHVTYVIYCLALFGSLRVLASSLRISALALLGVMVLGGGLDLVGRTLFGIDWTTMGRVPVGGVPIFTDLDWWGVPEAPQSLTMNLFWAPQHFFAAIIGTALLCCIFSLRRPVAAKLLHATCIIAAAALWSPYVAVGLAVVTLGAIPRFVFGGTFPSSRQVGWQGRITAAFLGAAGFVVLLLAFVAAFFAAAVPTSLPALIFLNAPVGGWALSFVLRQAPAIVALAALCIQRFRAAAGRRPGEAEAGRSDLLRTFGFLIAADALLLCFSHGAYNDWAMRTTLPVSILLAAALCLFLGEKRGLWARVMVVILLAISTASSLNELAQSAFLPRQCAPYGAFAWRDLGQFAGQYEGRGDSLLYRWLARQP
jgi:hypothetical protein